MFLINVAED
jgi:hypothetical protein